MLKQGFKFTRCSSLSTFPRSLASTLDSKLATTSSIEPNGISQRERLDSIGRALGVSPSSLDAWYEVTTRAFIKEGGSSLLKRHHFSLGKLLRSVYPDHNWDSSKFAKKEQSYWESIDNIRSFLENILQNMRKAGQGQEVWYSITQKDIQSRGGGGLLDKFEGSLRSLLSTAYPEHRWENSKFSKRPQGFWLDSAEQRRFLLALGRQLGFPEGSPEPWYNVTSKVIIKHGGVGLLNRYKGKLAQMLLASLPEYDWKVWKFKKVPANLTADPVQVRKAVEHLEAKFVRHEADWNRLTVEHLRREGLDKMIDKLGGLREVLRQARPLVSFEDGSRKTSPSSPV